MSYRIFVWSFVLLAIPFVSLGEEAVPGKPELAAAGIRSDGTVVEVDLKAANPMPRSGGPGTVVLQGSSLKFNILYRDVSESRNVGFDDPVNGAAYRDAAERALLYLDSIIQNTGELDAVFLPSKTAGTTTLGVATTYFPAVDGFQRSIAQTRVIQGVNLFPSIPEIEIEMNFGVTWHAGEGPPPFGQYDLFSVILHEATHSMGFASLTKSDGTSAFSSKTFTQFDQRLLTPSEQVIWDGTPPALQVPAVTLFAGPGSVEFGGSLGISAWGSGRPPVYSPTTFRLGSSIRHWEAGTTAGGKLAVMNPSIGSGAHSREFLPFEVGTLADLGYTVTVPTPIPSPTASPSPTETPVTTASPTATASPTVTPEPTATGTPTPTATAEATATASPTPEPTLEPTATPSPTPEVTATATGTATPTPTPVDPEDVVDWLLGGGENPPPADQNGDGLIDAADVVAAL